MSCVTDQASTHVTLQDTYTAALIPRFIFTFLTIYNITASCYNRLSKLSLSEINISCVEHRYGYYGVQLLYRLNITTFSIHGLRFKLGPLSTGQWRFSSNRCSGRYSSHTANISRLPLNLTPSILAPLTIHTALLFPGLACHFHQRLLLLHPHNNQDDPMSLLAVPTTWIWRID